MRGRDGEHLVFVGQGSLSITERYNLRRGTLRPMRDFLSVASEKNECGACMMFINV